MIVFNGRNRSLYNVCVCVNYCLQPYSVKQYCLNRAITKIYTSSLQWCLTIQDTRDTFIVPPRKGKSQNVILKEHVEDWVRTHNVRYGSLHWEHIAPNVLLILKWEYCLLRICFRKQIYYYNTLFVMECTHPTLFLLCGVYSIPKNQRNIENHFFQKHNE